ncbi:hypothetical protein KSP39_PZI003671 [Platanthera zijinensis]|uniref:RBR-type E3 ubiquitin transferase n=1 Tax=Platanthera zijinensis TaxID=2320716 RepID=A0AAP0GCL8_9ASPA
MEFHSPNPPVLILPDENPCRGSGFKNPIEIDDEVEVLGAMKINLGSSRKNPIVVEQERARSAKVYPFLNLHRKRFRTPKTPLMELPWAGKPVIYVGESSGTTLEEKLENDLGQSSGSVYSQPDSNCEICTEPKYPEELLPIEGCSHTYCKICVSLYVASKVETNVVFIKCPSPDCINGKLEPEMCSEILDDEVFDRWCMALCESVVDDKFYCPFKDCSALMINDKENVITDAECPHCSRLFCAQCMVPWHADFSCSEYQSLSKGERQHEDLMLMNLAKKRQWQRCPKCKFFVEKTEGCMFIKCR